MRPDKKTSSGLERVGDTDFMAEVMKRPEFKPSVLKLADAAAKIATEPDAAEVAFMARQLVQCTLPHSNPGDVPVWTRNNGAVTLVIARTKVDLKTGELIGYPYGSIPRLLLFWITTEAVQTGNPRLELGRTLNEFMRQVGLDPNTGGGKRGDGRRLRDQMRRLFAANISFQQAQETDGYDHERWLNMNVTEKTDLWWNPKHPDQIALWESWIELGQNFFDAITAAPVPVDFRALRALKRSPLALDLYAWATYKAYSLQRRRAPQFVPWRGLMKQLGASYGDVDNFKKYAAAALKKVRIVYPGLKIVRRPGGIDVFPSPTAIKPIPSRRR